MSIPFDYETLRIVWWVLLGVLLIGLAVMDGFDYGVAFLNPLLGKQDVERRVIINTIGPVWDGNQVWLILGGGAIFAAFPALYATSFSGFYFAMLAVLVSIILRPASIEYRNKVAVEKRVYWDWALFLSGLLPPLVFGVAFGNLFQGVPFYLDDMQLPHYVGGEGWAGWLGGFFALLNPFGLLCGVVSVAMLVAHGAVYLAIKTEDPIRSRAVFTIRLALIVWAVLFAAGGLLIPDMQGYRIVGDIAHGGPSNPLLKTVETAPGVWMANFSKLPILYVIPALAFLSALGTLLLTKAGRFATAFITSGLTVACTIGTAGVALFPFLLPSSKSPSHSLTVWDSTSSHLTLWLMTVAAVIFVPIVIAYTSWIFRVLRGPVTVDHVKQNSDQLY